MATLADACVVSCSLHPARAGCRSLVLLRQRLLDVDGGEQGEDVRLQYRDQHLEEGEDETEDEGAGAERPECPVDRQAEEEERSEEHTSELQSRQYLVCRLLLEKKKTNSLP